MRYELITDDKIIKLVDSKTGQLVYASEDCSKLLKRAHVCLQKPKYKPKKDIKELKRLVQTMWSAIENNKVDEQFFNLRQKVRELSK
jgi:hypothetical protein